MRRIAKRIFVLAGLVTAGLMVPVQAQVISMDIIYGGIEDAEVILGEYLRPYANILGSDLNAGWYNTARPHELGGLDVSFTVSLAKAPSSALSYDLAHMMLHGTADISQTSIAPTIAGSQEVRPSLTYSQEVDMGSGNLQEVVYSQFTLPDGTGVDFFPLPMAQLTVGLPFGTDVSARFFPSVGYRDYGEIGLWGVGGKHSVSQWLPFMEDLEFLDISVQGGFTSVTSSVHVVVEPQAIVEVDSYPDHNWDDQFVTLKVQGWTMNLIASQTFSVLTLYQGIGYANSMVDLLLEGHYPIQSVILDEGSADFGKVTYEIVQDPIRMKYENLNNLRLNAGLRIKLGVLTLHYDFTHTLYSTHSAGVGISFR
jgi:hypothetical protein